MFNVVELDTEKELLLKWFRKDENLVPPMYVLQPIKDILLDYRNFSKSKAERDAAEKAWWNDFGQLQMILRQSARKALSEESEIEKYIISGKKFFILESDQLSKEVRSLRLCI